MNEKEQSQPQDWRRVAEKDFERAARNLKDDDPEAAGYFLQQSLEKHLKAFLLERGWRLKKTHALHDLLTDAAKYHPSIEEFRSLCERVSGYYLVQRYPPLVSSGLSSEDVRKDIEEAKRFIKALGWPG
ncbi:MAG: HEPN domain-containing protein [Chloroflexi bacterium]|nr:HEPN domain-containing protein [Chloroflexota bacterium]